MNDYCIRYIPLPYTVKGITVKDEEDFYNIYINSNLSITEQRETIKHELTHIYRYDFDDVDKSIYEIENIG